jgi:hypothetical protein
MRDCAIYSEGCFFMIHTIAHIDFNLIGKGNSFIQLDFNILILTLYNNNNKEKRFILDKFELKGRTI